jgi:hypothetical protein
MTQFVSQKGVQQPAFTDLSGSLAASQYPAMTEFISWGGSGQGRAPSGATAYDLNQLYIPGVLTFSKMTVLVSSNDASNNYSWGLYSLAGALLASNTAATLPSNGSIERSNVEGSVTINPGYYLVTFVGASTTAQVIYGASTGMQHWGTSNTQSGGQVAGPITIAALATGSQQVQRSNLCIGFR